MLALGSARADYAFLQIDYPGAKGTSVFGINDRVRGRWSGGPRLTAGELHDRDQKCTVKCTYPRRAHDNLRRCLLSPRLACHRS